MGQRRPEDDIQYIRELVHEVKSFHDVLVEFEPEPARDELKEDDSSKTPSGQLTALTEEAVTGGLEVQARKAEEYPDFYGNTEPTYQSLIREQLKQLVQRLNDASWWMRYLLIEAAKAVGRSELP